MIPDPLPDVLQAYLDGRELHLQSPSRDLLYLDDGRPRDNLRALQIIEGHLQMLADHQGDPAGWRSVHEWRSARREVLVRIQGNARPVN